MHAYMYLYAYIFIYMHIDTYICTYVWSIQAPSFEAESKSTVFFYCSQKKGEESALRVLPPGN